MSQVQIILSSDEQAFLATILNSHKTKRALQVSKHANPTPSAKMELAAYGVLIGKVESAKPYVESTLIDDAHLG